MELKSVLLEREAIDESTVYGTSAIMLNETYILTTANLNLPLYKNKFDKFLDNLKTNEFYTDEEFLLKNSSIFRVIYKNSNDCSRFIVKTVELFAIYQSNNIKNLSNATLKDWSIDTNTNTKDLADILSLFFIYKMENKGDLDDFKNCLKLWWDSIKNQTIQQTDEIYIKSTPFGNRNFLETYNRGIVSNLIGPNSCLILSDCPATPGAEGSPVYKDNSDNNNHPIGIVISSLCWWKGDWTGLTFIADIRTILLEILGNPLLMNDTKLSPHPNLISACESSFVQVYSGSQWGTAVILDINKGLLLTNAHVIVDNANIRFFHKSQETSIPLNLIYKNPDEKIFDLALLYCRPNQLKRFNLNSINRTTGGRDLKVGDEVYCVGFSLFTKNVQINPSISKGYICQIDDGMIKTSCCINPGMSGGGILDSNGNLIGIIVSNIKLKNSNVYPRYNLIIPYYAIAEIIDRYIQTGSYSVLSALECQDPKSIRVWNGITAHL